VGASPSVTSAPRSPPPTSRPLSPAQMAERLAPRLSRSTEGLLFNRRADGLTTVNFQGRFTHLTLIQRTDQGTIQSGCIDSVSAANRWLGLSSGPSQEK